MLHQLDESLEDFLRAEVPLPRADVDFAFEAPDNEWGAGITKPTLNLFLWDIRLSPDEHHSGRRQVERNGRITWSEPLPRVSFRYLITAWTTEVRDEHQLLGSVLMTLLPNRVVPRQYLNGPLAGLQPLPSVRVSRPDGKDFAEFWSALEGQLKPGLDVIVVASLDAALAVPAGPPTEEYEIEVGDKIEAERRSRRRIVAGEVTDPEAVGAAVRSPRGISVVDENGRFQIPAEPGDELVVETRRAKRIRVPDTGSVQVD